MHIIFVHWMNVENWTGQFQNHRPLHTFVCVLGPCWCVSAAVATTTRSRSILFFIIYFYLCGHCEQIFVTVKCSLRTFWVLFKLVGHLVEVWREQAGGRLMAITTLGHLMRMKFAYICVVGRLGQGVGCLKFKLATLNQRRSIVDLACFDINCVNIICKKHKHLLLTLRCSFKFEGQIVFFSELIVSPECDNQIGCGSIIANVPGQWSASYLIEDKDIIYSSCGNNKLHAHPLPFGTDVGRCDIFSSSAEFTFIFIYYFKKVTFSYELWRCLTELIQGKITRGCEMRTFV